MTYIFSLLKISLIFSSLFFISCSLSSINNNGNKPVSYIVAFDSLGGSSVFPQLIASGSKVVEPTVPVWENHFFAGWYKDSLCSNIWVFDSDIIQSNITLYAKWTETTNLYYVIFNSLGENPFHIQLVPVGSLLTEPECSPTNGYGFCGWFTDLEFYNKWVFNDDRVMSDMVLYAKWVDLSYINFSTNTQFAVINGISGDYVNWLNLNQGRLYLPEIINGVPVTGISYMAFWYRYEIESVILPDNLRNIAIYAFCGCSSITSLNIPGGVTYIGEGAFSDCASLTSAEIPEGLTNIDKGLFSNCYGLTSIVIPEGVKSIGLSSFYGCNGLTNISLGGGVISIGDYAFANCTGLKTLKMYPLIAPALSTTPFQNVTGCTLHLKSGATGYDVAPWTNTSIFSSRVYDL